MSDELVIDARWLKTGIGRYTFALVKGLKASLSGIKITCISQSQNADTLSHYCDEIIISNIDIYSFREQLILPWIARRRAIFYAPHYNIPLLWRGKLIATIHDLNHILDATYRNALKSRLYAKPMLKATVDKADVIVTPSNYTKRMLQEHLHADSSRVTVIPCPVSDVFCAYEKKESRQLIASLYNIGSPYILFVGNLAPNKNVPLLLDSISRLRRSRRDVPILVIVGGGGKRKQRLQAYAGELGLHNAVVWLEEISNHALARLYSAAEMTVMPSLEEGFGLPVAESMACGTPVICSNAASLPEVAAGAAISFDPYSPENLTEAIATLLDSADMRQKAIASGLRRAKDFSLDQFAKQQTLAINKLISV